MTTSRRRTSRRRLHANAERWGRRAAGFLIFAKDTGRMLLMLRSGDVMEPRTWGLPGGRCEDEDADERDCAIREFLEETRCPETVTGPHEPVYIFREPGFAYFNFIGYVEHEFKPVLDWENDDFGWFTPDALPSPLHFGTRQLFAEAGAKILRMVPKRRSSKRRSSRRLTANKQESPLDNAAFRKWFGRSKVVDARGEPLVVYHGSPYLGIKVFDPGHGTALLGRGMYFTRDYDEALGYAKGDTETVYPVYLRVEWPFIRYESKFGPKGLALARQHIGRSAGPGSEGYIAGKLKMLAQGSFLPDNIPSAMLTSMFQADGYDGVFEGRHICVFSPTQIKSATDNVGTYALDNPDIFKNGRRR